MASKLFVLLFTIISCHQLRTIRAESVVKINAENEATSIDDKKAINDFQDRCSSRKCREDETCVLNQDGDVECACIAEC
ncbi:unnamed protein product, partial [Rotaria magnacalcarata]